MSDAVRKARMLYFIGIGIIFAGGFQVGVTLFTGRYLMSVAGLVCIAAAFWCCRVNGRIWFNSRS